MAAVARAWLIAAIWVVTPCAALAQSPDPLEGIVVREIRVTGLHNLTPEAIERHLATRVGQPFHRAALLTDRRRLDELRLFTAVKMQPRLEGEAVVLEIEVSETLRALPIVVVRVTDENGVSAGPGMKALNLLGHGAQVGASVRFGGETAVSVTLDSTTITPGTRAWHLGFSDTHRRNALYDFDEHATTVDARFSRNWMHGLSTGVAADLTALDTGTSGVALSDDGKDVILTTGLFVTVDTLDSSTNPRSGTWAEFQVDRLFGNASSWTFTADGRRFQRLSERHGLGLFALAAAQTGEVDVNLPEYLQYALGGGNSVRGWELGSRRGRNQVIGTLEYAYVAMPVRPFSVAGINLYAGLQVAAFADLGLAWNDAQGRTAASAIDGYGVGLRLQVPFVDLIRIDVAWGEPGEGAFAYFGVGLKAARQRQRVR